MKNFKILACALLWAVCFSKTNAATLRVSRAFPDLSFERPVFLTQAPGDSSRLFVVEQGGKIKVFSFASNHTRDAKVFLDLSSRVHSNLGEMGLLGMAFSPDYATSRVFFISYTVKNPSRLVIARLKSKAAQPEQVDLTSLQTVIEVPKNQDYENHNGGMIAFGPDKMLYIGTGDGGGAGDTRNNAQNLSLLLGKILRIDVLSRQPYSIPKDNPFVKQKNAHPAVWALGIRNAWRFSFDPITGLLWLGDVGQNKFEEINVVKKGGNYGWRLFEGRESYNNPNKLPLSKFEAPIFTIPHDPEFSVTGGYVYRGSLMASLKGKYIYGDYGSGKVWALQTNASTVKTNIELGRVPSLSSFGQSNDGELYMISLDGPLYRFESDKVVSK